MAGRLSNPIHKFGLFKVKLQSNRINPMATLVMMFHSEWEDLRVEACL